MEPGLNGLKEDANGEQYNSISTLPGDGNIAIALGNSKREGSSYLRVDAVSLSAEGYKEMVSGLFPMFGIGTISAGSDVWSSDGQEGVELLDELFKTEAWTFNSTMLDNWYADSVILHNEQQIKDAETWLLFQSSDENPLKECKDTKLLFNGGNDRLGISMFDSNINGEMRRHLIALRFDRNGKIVEEWRYSQILGSKEMPS